MTNRRNINGAVHSAVYWDVKDPVIKGVRGGLNEVVYGSVYGPDFWALDGAVYHAVHGTGSLVAERPMYRAKGNSDHPALEDFLKEAL